MNERYTAEELLNPFEQYAIFVNTSGKEKGYTIYRPCKDREEAVRISALLRKNKRLTGVIICKLNREAIETDPAVIRERKLERFRAWVNTFHKEGLDLDLDVLFKGNSRSEDQEDAVHDNGEQDT